jgi:hypothetical protein
MQKEPDEIHDSVRFTYQSGVIYVFVGAKKG